MGEMVKTRIPRIENPLDSERPETHARGGGHYAVVGEFPRSRRQNVGRHCCSLVICEATKSLWELTWGC